jgi:hypothetical protein
VVVLVPALVVTVTSTVPVPDGAVAVILVAFVTVNGAAFTPKFTALTLVKFVPVMITIEPPEPGPDVGFNPVTVGTGFGVQLARPAARSATIATTNAQREERGRETAATRRTLLILDRPPQHSGTGRHGT